MAGRNLARKLAVLGCLAITGCGSIVGATHPTPSVAAIPTAPAVLTFHPTSQAIRVEGGCGATAVYRGGISPSLDEAGGHNNPGDLPYAIADPPIAAGFLFSYPLRHGPEGNKILWVVGAPRNGATLSITMHPLDAPQPVVLLTKPADSWPGEIYPSGETVPTAGCWVLTLRWGTHQAEAQLRFS